MLRRIGIAVLIAALLVIAFVSLAKASPSLSLLEGQHGCTGTNPEYTLSDVNADVHYNSGSVKFNSYHKPGTGWNDTYLVSGFNRGSDATVLCGHFGNDYAYQLPFKASAPVAITGTLYFKAYNFAGTIGWDIWLVRAGEETRETTARAMEADHRSVEIMVTPGHARGRIYVVNGAWHRIYIGGGTMRNVDLMSLIHTSLRRIGASPSSYFIQAIPAGAEFTRGNFSVTGYDLRVTTSVSERRSASAFSLYTAKHGLLSITAARRTTVSVTRTVTLPVKGHPLGEQRATAARRAALEAQSAANTLAPRQALSEAHLIATEAMFARLHPYRVLPNVRHKHLGTAISILQHNGFLHLNWTRGLRPSAVVTWEAGHPGHLTATKAHISIRAKKR